MPEYQFYETQNTPASDDIILILDVSDKTDGAAGTTKKTTVQDLGSSGVPDATTTIKGKVKLAGDLGGTADLPTVPGLASKADLVDGVVPTGQLPALLALGESSTTAHRGDLGKTAYDHSQLTTGNPHNVTKSDVGLGNVPNVDCTNASNLSSGTIAIERLPPAALERLYLYTGLETLPENFGLTTTNVQNGDTVQINNVSNASDGFMWRVIDDSALNSSTGYHAYATGTAASVNWSGVTSKPANITDIASATFANDDFVQKKSDALTNRTIAQVKTDLELSGTNSGDETADRIAAINHGTSAKTTLVDADELTGQDSAVSFSLIRVTCANVFAYISAKILATANAWSKPQRVTQVALTSTSAHVAVDLALSNEYTHTLTENTTLDNPTNINAGMDFTVVFTQHASAAKTLTLGSYYHPSDGTTPALSTTVSAINVLVCHVNTSTHITCALLKHGVA